jgi:hypothetical protein
MKLFRILPAAALALSFVALPALAQDDEEFPPRDEPATVTVITDPPNSEVFLGGQSLGKSPITNRSVSSGRQTLIVIDQKKELVNERVNIWPNKPNKFEYKTVMPQGNIEVTTSMNCSILVDGELAGQTEKGASLTIRSLDAGDHLVEANCGRQSMDSLVSVGGESTVKVHLEKGKKKGKKK